MVSSNPSALGAGKGFQFARGKVEWRAYIPPGSGACDDWSSLWTDGQSWPTDGEIDTMECLGGTVAAHLHSSASGGAGNGPGIDAPGNFTGWHTFGFDWTASNVTFYYDGASIGTLPYTVASPNYLIMALEIPSGSVTVPEHQDIDWVRVWS
jgi:beta-glucanase (GH16 family)